MCDLKMLFLKTQFSLQNLKLAFKILRFQKNTFLHTIWKCRFFAFLNRNF
jgi:hypothetical protein